MNAKSGFEACIYIFTLNSENHGNIRLLRNRRRLHRRRPKLSPREWRVLLKSVFCTGLATAARCKSKTINTQMAIQIQAAYPDQLTALAQLLTQNHLSADDLPDGLPNFWLALDGDRLIGSVGIEAYGYLGLLRSVCVDDNYRHQGIAQLLCDLSFQEAHRQGIQDLYLLTTTADQYFNRLGFARVERTSIPDIIQKTRQFSDLCPSSAIVMKHTR